MCNTNPTNNLVGTTKKAVATTTKTVAAGSSDDMALDVQALLGAFALLLI
jgi:hypothetical protein